MQSKIKAFRDGLDEIIQKRDFSSEYASFLLPTETKILEESKKLAEELSDFENIAIIGIGGSNLGTAAIYDALDKSIESHIPRK